MLAANVFFYDAYECNWFFFALWISWIWLKHNENSVASQKCTYAVHSVMLLHTNAYICLHYVIYGKNMFILMYLFMLFIYGKNLFILMYLFINWVQTTLQWFSIAGAIDERIVDGLIAIKSDGTNMIPWWRRRDPI